MNKKSKTKSAIKQIKNMTARTSLEEDYDEPAWKGPYKDGVTQSILGRYFVCPERFRINYIDGLSLPDSFSHIIEYGQMWHLCEEHLKRREPWKGPLLDYTRHLAAKYKFKQEEIEHWWNVCKVQFEVYEEYWFKDDSNTNRIHLEQELEFSIPYHLPNGTVTLRGKFDAIDYWKNKGVELTENKSKGNPNESEIEQNLMFDLQTGFYLVALREWLEFSRPKVIPEKYRKPFNINYNVIRRPLSGGVGTIRRHKATKKKPAETPKEFYDRLKDIIIEDPEHFFMRWDVPVNTADIAKFERTCLRPILANLLDDYEWWEFCLVKKVDPFSINKRQKFFPNHLHRHYRVPYGIWNNLAKNAPDELDQYLTTGSKLGLVRKDEFFPELSE